MLASATDQGGSTVTHPISERQPWPDAAPYGDINGGQANDGKSRTAIRQSGYPPRRASERRQIRASVPWCGADRA
jgi:hypothetical protein